MCEHHLWSPIPGELDSLAMELQYNDGFVAYLNGTEVARRNAPASTNWNSAATTNRSDEESLVPEVINLTPDLNLVSPGINVLSFHALNSAANDDGFLLSPILKGVWCAGE